MFSISDRLSTMSVSEIPVMPLGNVIERNVIPLFRFRTVRNKTNLYTADTVMCKNSCIGRSTMNLK